LGICSVMERVPGHPQLFPSTTLFRSWVESGAGTGAELLVFPEYGAIEVAASFGGEIASDLQRTLTAVSGLADEMDAYYAELARRDRKSTRLNSSHVKTSYAVFCLKKK